MTKKVTIITGASSGIGEALAYEYASQSHCLIIAARRESELIRVANKIKTTYGTEVHYVVADVSKESDCKNIIDESIKQYGRIDILINNAVSSISGFSPLPARTAYCSSKYAIHGFLESLRIENMKNGLHIMIAAPEYTSTDIRKYALVAGGEKQGESPRDEKTMLTPEFVAERIARGVRKRRRSLVIGKMGTITVIVTRLFPKLSDKLIYNYIKKEANSPF